MNADQIKQLLEMAKSGNSSIDVAAIMAAASQQTPAPAPAPAPAAAPAPAPAPSVQASSNRSSILDRLRTAPDPTNYDPSFAHESGLFDGIYQVKIIKAMEKETRTAGKLFAVRMEILESSNDHVSVGSYREHALFLRKDVAVSELKGLVQFFWRELGNDGDIYAADAAVANDFVNSLIDERQAVRGQEFRLVVHTGPQKNNPAKTFTKLRWSSL